jgi:sodium/bile acid cotransporter 7
MAGRKFPFVRVDGFVLSIFLAIILAWLFPEWGGNASPLPLGQIGKAGVWLIFFFYGLKLGPDKLLPGLKNWKLHLLIQVSTFLIFPLLVLPFRFLAQTPQDQVVWLGFFFLAALPSTVSSSVVLVSLAKGNIPAALFNATISGLIGVIVTPLWLQPFGHDPHAEIPLSSVYYGLALGILLPVGLGLMLQKWLGHTARTYASPLATFDKSVILLILFHSFTQSFQSAVFDSVSWVTLGVVLFACLVLLGLIFQFTGLVSEKLGFSREDQITARYCGSKKSLVHGTVFAGFLFPAGMELGLILLPLVLYHALQLVVVGAIAQKQAQNQA